MSNDGWAVFLRGCEEIWFRGVFFAQPRARFCHPERSEAQRGINAERLCLKILGRQGENRFA